MTIGIDYFRKRAPGPPKSDPVRNAKIVERAANGEKYSQIGKDFNLCGERIRQIVNRAKWEAEKKKNGWLSVREQIDRHRAAEASKLPD